MRASFSLGKLFGIPIRINYTWFLILALLTFSLSAGFREVQEGLAPAIYWIVAFAGSLFFLGSVLAHELAHSLVARAQGSPVRDITLFLFGGVSSIEKEADRPLQEVLMAGVGPATSLVLALLFGGLSWLLGSVNVLAGAFFAQLAIVNGLLAVFNLLPGLPLDGGRILRAIVWKLNKNYRKATGIAAIAGRVVSFAMIIGGLVWSYLSLRGGQLNWNGLWFIFIGWFMDNAATQSYQQALLQEALRGVTVADLMTADCTRIPRGLSVANLVDDYLLHQGGRCFLVTDDERLSGLLTVHNVRTLPREQWPYTPVGEVMTPYRELVVAHPGEDAWAVLLRMDQRNVNQVPVEEEGRLLGMLSRENLLRYVRTRAELQL
jgi:Zn-dependent protease/CBS domain-containing protein